MLFDTIEMAGPVLVLQNWYYRVAICNGDEVVPIEAERVWKELKGNLRS